MHGMSERPDRSDENGLWVVEVTAPLASGRVREVAADAAARLKLPVEKLVALLENRIGPVTKPLPHASASRVAEVLDLSGAEVALRPAEVDPEAALPPEPAVAAARAAPAAPEAAPDAPDVDAPGDAADAPDGAEPAAPSHDAPVGSPSRDPAPPADAPDPSHASVRPHPFDPARGSEGETAPAALDHDAGAAPSGEASAGTVGDASDEASDEPTGDAAIDASAPSGVPPVLGRAGRGRDGGAAAARAAPRDAWFSLDDDRSDEDEAMLGRWTLPSGLDARTPSRPLTPVGDPTSASRAPEAAPSSPAAEPASPSPASEPAARPRPIGERPPVAEHAEDDDASWAYGLRDPFADAEARERRVRRWTLMIALLVASTIFVALQWAYSRPDLGDASPPPFAEGLAAYRQGAFVSAARLWTPRAEAGDVEAMFLLGWMAEFGQGRPWSNREAASWYRQAAERGHPRAQLRLADLYRAGLGVEFDEDAALRWYRAAAEGGVTRAQREVALALARDGRRDEARAWLARAAAGDDPVAVAWWSLEADGVAMPVSP
jgi:hypothetical protein